MVAISAEEKKVISERYPNVHIVRTMKHDSKRHRYYCTEDRRVMSLLAVMRGIEDDQPKAKNKKRRGGSYRS